jgi:Protein of unknown function (DUF2959)
MKKSKTINILTSLTIAAALAVMAGCTSDKGNYQQGAATGAQLVDAAGKIADGSGSIDATLTSLNDLVNNPQGDLVPKFKKFNDNVTSLQALSDNVKTRFTDARVKGNAYFQDWDAQIATIRSQSIKDASTKRRNAVFSEYNDLKRSYAQTTMSFDPFMSDLKDIQTALSTDLTVGGVGAVKGATVKANSDGTKLKASVIQLSSDFRTLGTAMQAAAPVDTGTNQMNQ